MSSVYVPARESVSGPWSEAALLNAPSNTTLLYGSTSRHRALGAPLRACASTNTRSPAAASKR
jgi:hypothetical protein